MANDSKNTAKKTLPHLSASGSPFATVLVGPEKKPFVVHQDLLTYHSNFFRAALTGNSREAEEKTVSLPEDNEIIFEFFVHWLYHKRLPTTDNASTELLEQWRIGIYPYNHGNRESDNLIKLHVFADKYGVERMKTDALNGLFIHLRPTKTTIPYQHSIDYAQKHLPDKSPLLNFLTDLQCGINEEDWAKFGIEGYPLPYLVSVLERLSRGARGELDVLSQLKLCNYHEHKNKDERKACPHRYTVMD